MTVLFRGAPVKPTSRDSVKPAHKYPPLSPQQIRELSTLISAGIATVQAWEKSSASLHPASPVILALLQKGTSLARAMGHYGLLTAAHGIFLATPDNACHLPAALQRLATESEHRAQRLQKMKSRWGVLYLLLLVGWLAGSITAGLAEPGRITGILFLNTLTCIGSYYFLWLIAKLASQNGWWWLGLAWKFGWQRRKVFQWSFTIHWLDLLGWQLAAGVDAATALQAMQGLISTPSYRSATAAAMTAVRDGKSLSTALATSGLLPNQTLAQVLVSAEASGKIGESLAHQTNLAEPNLKLYMDSVMFWLSKALYALVAAVAFAMVFLN